jgi:hypothetical protein
MGLHSLSGRWHYFFIQIMFGLHRKHTYEPPLSATSMALLFSYADYVRVSQEKHLWASCPVTAITILYHEGNIVRLICNKTAVMPY